MNDLKTKTCKELREIAKGFEIKGRWDMTKDELIKAINESYHLSDDEINFESLTKLQASQILNRVIGGR